MLDKEYEMRDFVKEYEGQADYFIMQWLVLLILRQ